MTLKPDYMPYAPATPVLKLIRRARDGRLLDAYPPDQLVRLGVAEGNADRVHAALAFLGLIDDDSAQKTETFERLSRVSTEEYPKAMGEVVQNAYAPILAVVDPQEANDIAMHDAFRGYNPAAQRARMVALFLALCRESGLVEGGPVEGQRAHVRPRVTRPAALTPKQRTTSLPTTPEGSSQTVDPYAPTGDPTTAPDYRLLGELLRQLPRDGRWSAGFRDRWIQAVTATVDLLVAVDEESGLS